MAKTPYGLWDYVNAPYPDYAQGNSEHPIGVQESQRQIEATVVALIPGTGSGLADPGSNGLLTRTAAGVTVSRQLVQPSAGLTISNSNGVAGNPTFALADDLAALESLSSTGFSVRTGTSTWAQRSLANAAAGLTWTNGDGVSGNPTPVFANDLGALEALSGTGRPKRTATDTWTLAAIDLTAEVAGTLPIGSGGTGATTFAANGVLYGNAGGAIQALGVNSAATNKFLTQSSSAGPTWVTIVPGDIQALAVTWGPTQIFTLAPIVSAMTAGSVLFAGAAGLLSQDNARFFWDNTNHRLGLGTAVPQGAFHVHDGSNRNLRIMTDAGSYATSGMVIQSFNDAVSLNVPLVFAASSFSLMEGNVGIGTLSPLATFHTHTATNQNLYIRNFVTPAELQIAAANDSGSAYVPLNIDGLTLTLNSRSLGVLGIGVAAPLAPVHVHITTNQNLWIRNATLPTEMQLAAVNDAGSAYVPLEIDGLTVSINGQSLGNVGIGTLTPHQRLEVAGLGVFTQAALTGDPGGGIIPATIVGYNSTSDYGFISAVWTGVSSKNLTLQPAGGFVGIGIISPVTTLHVAGVGIQQSGNFYNSVRFTNLAGTRGLLLGYDISNTNGVIASMDGSDIQFWSYSGAWGERVRFANTGNVGIGTATPHQKLEVAGLGIFTQVAISPDPSSGAGPTIGPATIVGYNSTNDYGYVNAINTGVVIKNLSLQPFGGNVGVGTITPRKLLDLFSTTQSQLRLTYTDNSVYSDFQVNSAGNLTISPTGSLITLPNAIRFQSANYASQITGLGLDMGLGAGDFRYLYADELHARSFIADLEQALAGAQIIVKSVAPLAADFTVPAASGTATLVVESFKGFDTFRVFVDGDYVNIRQFSRSGTTLDISNCWGTVVWVSTDTTAKTQTYTFTRSAAPNAGAATTGSVVGRGALALDWGTTGNGGIEANAIDGAMAVNSPYTQIVTWTSHPNSGKVVRTRTGNLKGISGVTEYGLYAGDGAIAAANRYLRITDSNFELQNLDLNIFNSGNKVIALDYATPALGIGPTAPTGYLSSTGYWVGNSGGTYKSHLGTVSGGVLTQGYQWSGVNFDIKGGVTADRGLIATWTINATSMSSGTTYIASNFAIPGGQTAWFGKGPTGDQGVYLADASTRSIDMRTGNSGIYPYLAFFDGTRFRVVLGGLNNAFGSDGSTTSMGMKVWNVSGTKLVEFSDIQNRIASWDISETRISSTNIFLDQIGHYISLGTSPPTSYGSNVGVFLEGANGGRFSIYKDASNYFQWDSAKLIWKAANTSLDASGNLTVNAGVIASWTITGSTISSGGIVLLANAVAASNAIYVGTGSYASTNTAFYVDGLGQFSLKDRFTWNGTTGTIAGWTFSTSRLSSTNVFIDQAGQYISMGASPPTYYGSNVGVFIEGANSGRMSLYKDANNYLQWDSAKILIKAANFTLDASGNLTATSATLSGAVTATSGSITGTLAISGAGKITASQVTLDANGIFLDNGIAAGSQVKWGSAGTTYGRIYNNYSTTVNTLQIQNFSPAGDTGGISQLGLNTSNDQSETVSLVLSANGSGSGGNSGYLVVTGSTGHSFLFKGMGIGPAFSGAPTAMLDVRGAIKLSDSWAANYIWTSWNPPDLAGNYANASSSGTADGSSTFYTFSNSSGTLTVTLKVAGKYSVTVYGQAQHANVWTYNELAVVFGGSAGNTNQASYSLWGPDPASAGNSLGSAEILVTATANQTVTILPKGRVSAGAGTAGQHTFFTQVLIKYLGG